MANKVYGASLKAESSMKGPVRRGGSRALNPRLQTMRMARMRNPMIRTVQPKPNVGRSDRTRAGKISPPVDEPQADIPIARLLLLEKYVDRRVNAGQKSKPLPRPTQTP